MDSRIEPYVQVCREDDRRLLTEAESKELLGAFDVPVVDESLVTAAEAAADRAEELGFPVVLKGVSPDVPHKSEAGIIQLDLRSREEVAAAFETVRENLRTNEPDARFDGVLVQPYTTGEETILGMNADPQFGPVILFGLGGVFVEIFDDVSLRLPPVDAETARGMVADLRGEPLLTGARGQTPRDVDAVVETVVRFSEFVRAVDPLVAEVDVNPLIVREDGGGAVAVDALVRLSEDAVATAK